MRVALRRLDELGEDVVLAPERWTGETGEGVPLGELVLERRERADATNALVLDTTHARDGVLDVAAAARATGPARSAKKSAHAGDLVVSRLRPYLRQIAYVHPRALEAAGRPLALSSEFYVLAPRRRGEDLAFLLPFLLGDAAQAALASAQEGGHHPRVPRASLLALRAPHAIVARRRELSRRVLASLEALYRTTDRWQELMASVSTRAGTRG
jgi:hypothetical protein